MNYHIRNWLIFIVCIPILFYCLDIFPSQTTYEHQTLVSTGIFVTFAYVVYFIIFLITPRYEKFLNFFYNSPCKNIEKIILFKSDKNSYYKFIMLSGLLDFFILSFLFTSPAKIFSIIPLGDFLTPIIEQINSYDLINTPYLLLTHVPPYVSLLLPIVGPAVLYVLYVSNKHREISHKKFIGSRTLVVFLWACPFFLFLIRIPMKSPESEIFDLSILLAIISSLIAGMSYGAIVQLYQLFVFSKFKLNKIPRNSVNIDLSISDSEGQQLISDKINLSLYAANKYLGRIPSTFPNNSSRRAEFELVVEGFLLYMIATRDGLLQKINSKLSLPLPDDEVHLNQKFKQQLSSDPNSKFQTILSMIEDCTQEPEKVISGTNIYFWQWDRTKSWLWEINRMRNRVAHRTILGQRISVIVGSGSGMTTKLIIDEITKQPLVKIGNKTSRVPITNPKEETILEDDPKKYFTECYMKLEKLKNDINGLLL